MVEKLVTSLRALAASSEAQLARFPEVACKANELALDFADALLMVSDCPQVLLTGRQRQTLQRIDDQLLRMSGEANVHLWLDSALGDSDEWAAVRQMAVEALMELGYETAD